MSKRDIVGWIVSRLVDNYEWQNVIEYEDWIALQDVMRDAILSSDTMANKFIDMSEQLGVIEE